MMAETEHTAIAEGLRNGGDLPNGNNTPAAILPELPPISGQTDTSTAECTAAAATSGAASSSAAAAPTAAVKRRKTRRGKTKRRNTGGGGGNNAYVNPSSKPEAPYNSNRFLIEDHGDDLLDDDLQPPPQQQQDQASTSTTLTRTRDSSFSMEDSDGPSEPPYCDPFNPSLIRDFDKQYESLQVERLQSMSKDELIQEFMRYEHMMERKVATLVEQMKKPQDGSQCQNDECRGAAQRLQLTNDILRQENDAFKAALKLSSDSDDSVDSESDSKDSSDEEVAAASSGSGSASGSASTASSLSRSVTPGPRAHEVDPQFSAPRARPAAATSSSLE